MKITDDIKAISPRMTDAKRKALSRLGIDTIYDLLHYFPSRYETSGDYNTISDCVSGTDTTVFGRIKNIKTGKTFRSRKPMAEAVLEDHTGTIKIRWFSQPYMAKMFHDGEFVKVSGKITGQDDKKYIANPAIERADQNDTSKIFGNKNNKNIFAIYPETKGVSSLWIRDKIERIVASGLVAETKDPIPAAILDKYNLPQKKSALIWMHTPRKMSDATAARKRFAFEEVFLIQLVNQLRRMAADSMNTLPVEVNQKDIKSFIDSFPFKPTSAQNRVIKEILKDFNNMHPMTRLMEGDVGSGKTAVAAATAYAVVNTTPPNRESGALQVAYMVPTEVLAKQHFRTFVEFFKDYPVKIGMITGKDCYKFPSKLDSESHTKISKAQLLKWIAGGEISIVIGTHALIQKSVSFQNLAYTIIDEQHRFGKVQRHSLSRKDGMEPHLLSMTATPIPRTLALTIYGDLDLSLLDAMPSGRKPIKTEIVDTNDRVEMYARVKEELEAGRQAYVICPRIDEPDPKKISALQAKSVKAESARLKKDIFADYEIGMLHGKMTPAEKEAVMTDFENKKIDILVATSVIEVGINVPNATVIIIEGAERFGLAQLHQLRGRVLRSSHQAYCFVVPESKGETTRERLSALKTAKDGFELAEYDFKIRGGGELYGRRQWGVSDIAMEAIKNIKMVEAARNEAVNFVKEKSACDDTLANALKNVDQSLHPE